MGFVATGVATTTGDAPKEVSMYPVHTRAGNLRAYPVDAFFLASARAASKASTVVTAAAISTGSGTAV